MAFLKRAFGPAILLAGAIVVWSIPATSLPALGNPPPPPPQQESMGGYLGMETCLECHEDMGASLLATRHGLEIDPRTPAAKLGCESCHGPGEQHMEGGGDPELIGRFDVMTPADISEVCTDCHNRGEHAFWDISQHNGRDLTCTTCHSIHHPESPEYQLKEVDQAALCSQCHQDKAAKIQRASHMPLREGKMECTSCHNPHGSANVRMLAVGMTVNDSCTSCHAEKRGPVLWEHAPVQESCTSCHDPHGSSNDRLLVAKAPLLCQRCHAHTRHPARPYDGSAILATQAFGRSCVNCHQNIHGSNHPSGQFFLR